jgi:hypothetical protein
MYYPLSTSLRQHRKLSDRALGHHDGQKETVMLTVHVFCTIIIVNKVSNQRAFSVSLQNPRSSTVQFCW